MTLSELLSVRSLPGQSGQQYGMKIKHTNPGVAAVTTESCTYIETVERCGRHYCDTYHITRDGRRNVASSYKFLAQVYNSAGVVVANYGFSVINEAGQALEISCRCWLLVFIVRAI